MMSYRRKFLVRETPTLWDRSALMDPKYKTSAAVGFLEVPPVLTDEY